MAGEGLGFPLPLEWCWRVRASGALPALFAGGLALKTVSYKSTQAVAAASSYHVEALGMEHQGTTPTGPYVSQEHAAIGGTARKQRTRQES